MPDLARNTLGDASSPYLLQHKDDPVHWQEWTREVLEEAKKRKKLIFVSIGYATCHWCHVMARESFRDDETAAMLNADFVAIKVDREQRPDIDSYFLDYVNRVTGSGGWPMSVILAPDGHPVFGGTYFPLTAENGGPTFKEVLAEAVKWQQSHPDGIPAGHDHDALHVPEHEADAPAPTVAAMLKRIAKAYDTENGGFGSGTKFPPHATLLFLMGVVEQTNDKDAKKMVRQTLDAMALRGLHDHLQGGFYRYCTERAWTIPHFEKMLYDQAMHLWTYSVAYALWKDPFHLRVTEKLIACLEQTFADDGLYVAAHDADTDHQEGETYVWSEDELIRTLTPHDYEKFSAIYEMPAGGNFEGKTHLLRTAKDDLDPIEQKLMKIRNKRAQPFTDRKIVTHWNALLGIALVMHARCTGNSRSLKEAEKIAQRLQKKHLKNGQLLRSSLGSTVQPQGFLEDYAAMTALLTMLAEEKRDEESLNTVKTFVLLLEAFRVEGRWIENPSSTDFRAVPADTYDHPTPSSISMAEFALYRAQTLLEMDIADIRYRQPLGSDFGNLTAMHAKGAQHVIHGPEKIDWKLLPPFSMQIPGKEWQDCVERTCRRFADAAQLRQSL